MTFTAPEYIVRGKTQLWSLIITEDPCTDDRNDEEEEVRHARSIFDYRLPGRVTAAHFPAPCVASTPPAFQGKQRWNDHIVRHSRARGRKQTLQGEM